LIWAFLASFAVSIVLKEVITGLRSPSIAGAWSNDPAPGVAAEVLGIQIPKGFNSAAVGKR
jgi:hypothetical protein